MFSTPLEPLLKLLMLRWVYFDFVEIFCILLYTSIENWKHQKAEKQIKLSQGRLGGRLDLIYQDVLTEHKLASNTIKASQIKSNKTRGMQGEIPNRVSSGHFPNYFLTHPYIHLICQALCLQTTRTILHSFLKMNLHSSFYFLALMLSNKSS